MALATAPKTKKALAENSTFNAERDAFRRQFKSLLRRYRNQFVALSRGRVVGHGSDDEALAERLFNELGTSEFAIFLVREKPEIHEFTSPESVA